jgi:cation diffusion facilitator CzcD-associated flavoprotein CzcO
VLHSTTVKATEFDEESKSWNLQLLSSGAERAVSCKHVVLATGAGLQGPYVPDIPGVELYGGVNMHSVSYKSGKELAGQGVKVR